MLVGGADPSADARRAWSAAASAPAFDDIGRLLAETAPALVVVGATFSCGPQRRPAEALQLVNLGYDAGALAQSPINRLARTGTRYLDFRVDCGEATLRASYGGRAFVRVGWKRAEKPGVRV